MFRVKGCLGLKDVWGSRMLRIGGCVRVEESEINGCEDNLQIKGAYRHNKNKKNNNNKESTKK